MLDEFLDKKFFWFKGARKSWKIYWNLGKFQGDLTRFWLKVEWKKHFKETKMLSSLQKTFTFPRFQILPTLPHPFKILMPPININLIEIYTNSTFISNVFHLSNTANLKFYDDSNKSRKFYKQNDELIKITF